ETRRQVARWAARTCPAPAVRYVPVAGRAHGPAAARNRGWRAASGEVVAFTDDDCVPAPGWLRAGLEAFCDCRRGDADDGVAAAHEAAPPGCRTPSRRGAAGDEVAGAWGTIVMPLPPVPTDYELDAAGLERAECVTANCFYRRAALAAAGGFDERFTMAWREDADLFFTLLERGARIACAPAAVVVHPVRPAPWGISLRQQRKSMFNALLYKKHPALYRRRIQPAPPWRYYRIVGALFAAGAAALGGRRRLACLAAAAWAGMTARFCAQRLARTSRAPRHVAEMAVTSALIPPLALFWRLR